MVKAIKTRLFCYVQAMNSEKYLYSLVLVLLGPDFNHVLTAFTIKISAIKSPNLMNKIFIFQCNIVIVFLGNFYVDDNLYIST